jgi:hypothetical protein
MKHRIDAPAGSDEFRAAFRMIRNAFIAQLDQHLEGRNVTSFRACDSNGTAFAWVWDNDLFRNEHTIGTLADAKSFMANMIDQGMQFAFLGAQGPAGVDVWLTTWESPEEGPNWPKGVVRVFEEVHEGVTRG